MKAIRNETQVTTMVDTTTFSTSFLASGETMLYLSIEITGEAFNNIMTGIGFPCDDEPMLAGCILVPADFDPVSLFTELAYRTERTGVLPSVDVVFGACLFISLV